MKALSNYIKESHKFLVKSKAKKLEYKWFPKDKTDLVHIIKQRIKDEGPTCDLNDIDVSKITDMSGLFRCSKFNGDISHWDVSNVVDMHEMFSGNTAIKTLFNGDISNWDVSSVVDMSQMFEYSSFDNDISSWDVSNVKDMYSMFRFSKFNQDISQWDVRNVKDMFGMFCVSEFNQDISKWNIQDGCKAYAIFTECPILLKNRPNLDKCNLYP